MMMYALLVHLSVLYLVYGCGLAPFGQERTRRFNVTGFLLPPSMVYTEVTAAAASVPTISTTEQAARRFVENLIDQSIVGILEEQGRNAGLGYSIISLILEQLTVRVQYKPFKCTEVYTVGTVQNNGKDDGCFIIENIVRNSLCEMPMCKLDPPPPEKVKQLPSEHLTISGTLTTNNIIMANWSTQMWQSVLNRVASRLSSGPLSVYFTGVVVNITD